MNAASSEGRPILARCNSQAPPERAPERLRTSEAAGIRDFIESQCRQFKLTSRSFETKVLNVLRRCFAHFLLKQASEVTRTHGRASCQTLDREFAPDVIWKPGKQVAQRAVLPGLCCKSRAELRLAARALQKHNHDLCNFEGNRSA